MSDLTRQKLCEIIARHGRSLCDDPRRCEALLRDLCGEQRREVTVLVGALKERVAADLLSSSTAVPTDVLLARLTKRLHDDSALTQNAARWAVESWALALGIITLNQCTVRHVESAESSEKDPREPLDIFRGDYVSLALADGVLQPEEKKYLLAKAQELGISQEAARDVIRAEMKKVGATTKTPPSRAPALEVDATNFDFQNLHLGSTASGSFMISNVGGGVLNGTITTNRKWLSVSQGNINPARRKQDVGFSLDTSSLPCGFRDIGEILVQSNGGDWTIPVSISIEMPPTPSVPSVPLRRPVWAAWAVMLLIAAAAYGYWGIYLPSERKAKVEAQRLAQEKQDREAATNARQTATAAREAAIAVKASLDGGPQWNKAEANWQSAQESLAAGWFALARTAYQAAADSYSEAQKTATAVQATGQEQALADGARQGAQAAGAAADAGMLWNSAEEKMKSASAARGESRFTEAQAGFKDAAKLYGEAQAKAKTAAEARRLAQEKQDREAATNAQQMATAAREAAMAVRASLDGGPQWKEAEANWQSAQESLAAGRFAAARTAYQSAADGYGQAQKAAAAENAATEAKAREEARLKTEPQERKVEDTTAVIAGLEKELQRQKAIEEAALKAQDESARRKADIEKRQIMARLKAEQLRQQTVEEQRKKSEQEQQEDARQQTELARKKQENEQRLAMLKKDVEEKRKEIGRSSIASLSPQKTLDEMHAIDRKIRQMREQFRAELKNGINQVVDRLNPRYLKLADAKRDEFESEPEFQERITKERAALDKEQAGEFTAFQNRLESEYNQQLAPFIEELKKLSGQEFTITSENLTLELGTYDGVADTYPVSIRAKRPVEILREASSTSASAAKELPKMQYVMLAANANIPIPRDEAREFKQHFQNNMLRPEIKGNFQTPEVFTIAQAYVIDDATKKQYDLFSARFVDLDNGTLYDTSTKLIWSKRGSETSIYEKDIKSNTDLRNSDAYLGFRDWRCPSKDDLATLVSYARSKGYGIDENGKRIADFLNKEGFSNIKPDWYWTSTRMDKNDLFVIHFGGGTWRGMAGHGGFYLPVRSGSAPSERVPATSQPTSTATNASQTVTGGVTSEAKAREEARLKTEAQEREKARLAAAEEKAATAAKKDTATKKKAVHVFHGKLAAVDKTANSIKVGESVYQITSETKITKGSKSATLEDGVVGELVFGYYYSKQTEDGKMAATAVQFKGR